MQTAHRPSPSFDADRFALQVGEIRCVVRATPVWPIAEVLDLEDQVLASAGAEGRVDPGLLRDLLDSRMIASPRPRRRQRAVSSRAVFLAATGD